MTCHQVAVLQEYWDLYDSHPHVQGGFIWDWVDQVHKLDFRCLPVIFLVLI